jgi:Cu/Ag efflux pump CusA
VARIPIASPTYIDTVSGQRMSYVAELRQATGPNTIRESTLRRFVVSSARHSDLNAVVEQLERDLDKN